MKKVQDRMKIAPCSLSKLAPEPQYKHGNAHIFLDSWSLVKVRPDPQSHWKALQGKSLRSTILLYSRQWQMQGFNNSFKKVTIPKSPINIFHDRCSGFLAMQSTQNAIESHAFNPTVSNPMQSHASAELHHIAQSSSTRKVSR
jgi:hypothetical protein